MIVEALEKYYRARAIERNEQPQRWNRGSSMGYCPRRLTYQKLGVKGDPLTARRLSIFDDGNFYDAQLKGLGVGARRSGYSDHRVSLLRYRGPGDHPHTRLSHR